MAKSADEMLNKLDGKLDEMTESLYKIDKEVALQKAALEDHTIQDEKMYEEFKRMNDVLQANTDSLKEHINNNVLLKEMINKMDQRLAPIEVERIQREAVSKDRKEMLKRIGKYLAIAATLLGIVMGMKPLLLKLLLGIG